MARPRPLLKTRSPRRRWLRGIGCLLFAGVAGAAPRTAAAGPVVLEVSGRLKRPRDGEVVRFDMAALEALPQTSFTTRTPWYARARRFTGPLLRDVLDAAGARGSLLRVSALNDYRVELPFDDALRHDLILARLIDGQPMAVRDKGPLFMVYPFDAHPELRSAVYYSRSVWQLKSIEVL